MKHVQWFAVVAVSQTAILMAVSITKYHLSKVLKLNKLWEHFLLSEIDTSVVMW